MRIIVASKNEEKIEEFRSLLSEYEIVSLNDIGWNQEIIEDGQSFFENAKIKAHTISEAFPSDYVLADDSGLVIDILEGRPGVLSARYAGDHDDDANIEKVLYQLRGTHNRSAHFTTSLVLSKQGERDITAVGKVNGHITKDRFGENGMGYDPIFYANELEKTFGNSTLEEKNSVSHRARAIKNLKQKLNA